MRRSLLILLLALLPCAFMPGDAYARRTSKSVRQERRETGKKIERTRSKIKENTNDTRRQLARLERVEAEIALCDRQLAALSARIDTIGRQAKALTDSVAAAEKKIGLLKESYASSLRTIRTQRQTASPSAFIFSSRSFDQARRRIRYLRELGQWQTEKAAALKNETVLLNVQKIRLDSISARLEAIKQTIAEKKTAQEASRDEADVLVAKLKRQGRALEKTLDEQQRQAQRLDKELERIIEEEARQAAEAERRRKAEEAKKTKEKAAPKPGEKAPKPGAGKKAPAMPASTFEKSKGSLPMPVSGTAIIVSGFGRHTHKELSKVEVMNNGIDIETMPGASALAVYPGVVSMVIVMDGYHNVVLVRHGEYLTVYAGISELAVRKGQPVIAGQNLGTIYSDPDDDGRTRLHFEVRHEKEKLDPAEWLR